MPSAPGATSGVPSRMCAAKFSQDLGVLVAERRLGLEGSGGVRVVEVDVAGEQAHDVVHAHAGAELLLRLARRRVMVARVLSSTTILPLSPRISKPVGAGEVVGAGDEGAGGAVAVVDQGGDLVLDGDVAAESEAELGVHRRRHAADPLPQVELVGAWLTRTPPPSPPQVARHAL